MMPFIPKTQFHTFGWLTYHKWALALPKITQFIAVYTGKPKLPLETLIVKADVGAHLMFSPCGSNKLWGSPGSFFFTSTGISQRSRRGTLGKPTGDLQDPIRPHTAFVFPPHTYSQLYRPLASHSQLFLCPRKTHNWHFKEWHFTSWSWTTKSTYSGTTTPICMKKCKL